MVGKMAGRPFTLLGINSDQDRSVLKKKFEKEKITWPNILEGKEHAVSREWNVHVYPTIYLIDADGVIRQRDINGPGFEGDVEKMVAEAEKRKGKGGG